MEQTVTKISSERKKDGQNLKQLLKISEIPNDEKSKLDILPRWFWPLIVIIAFLMFPAVHSVRYHNLLIEFMIFGLFVMSANIVMGYTGMVSFAQAAFFGIGAGKNYPGLHHPDYDFPDSLIEHGCNMFIEIYKKTLF